MTATYTLVGSPFSYFTGKARAYLRYKKADYVEVLSTMEVFSEVIKPKTGLNFIPIVLCKDGRVLQDTSAIIDELELELTDVPSVTPTDATHDLLSHIFELIGDEWLVLPAMHYRWSFPDNFDYIFKCFGSVASPDGTPEEQRAAGEIGCKYFRTMPQRVLGLTTPAMVAAVENWTLELLRDLNVHFASHRFLLGDRPTLGDFGLFGPLFAHLYLDPVPGKIMRDVAPHVARWCDDVHLGAAVDDNAKFLPEGSGVPSTLVPVIRRCFEEFWPVLGATEQLVCEYVQQRQRGQQQEQQPIVVLPRRLDPVSFSVGGVIGTRASLPWSLWKRERVLQCWRRGTSRNSGRGGQEMRTAMAGVHHKAVEYLSPRPRLEYGRQNFRISAVASSLPTPSFKSDTVGVAHQTQGQRQSRL